MAIYSFELKTEKPISNPDWFFFFKSPEELHL